MLDGLPCGGYNRAAAHSDEEHTAMIRKFVPAAAVALAAAVAGASATANRGVDAFLAPADAAPAPAPAAPDLRAGYDAIDAGDYETAIAAFETALAQDPRSAEAHNQLGYIHRRLQEFDRAFAHYRTALALDPAHTGAHHYIGEAYLETGDLAAAERHLRALDLICLFGCDDYYALEQAVALYKANAAS